MYDFTPDELVFMQRMLPHFMAGKSVEACPEAVIAEDARIFEKLMKWHDSETRQDDARGMRRVISDHIYGKIRAAT